MNELENRLENGLKKDGRLVIEGIKSGKKSGAGVFWDLILSLNQAHENDEYEPPESFFSLFPDHVKFIQSGDNHIRYEVEQIRTLFQIWHEIYKAASETKNQIGLDEMMEWGKAFAEKYADFRVALENQKNYISYQLPAIAEIKTLKAELEKAKTTPETYAVGIESHLKRLDSIEKWMSSMYEKMDVVQEFQKANRAAARKEHTEIKQIIRQKQKENRKRPGLTQEQAALEIQKFAWMYNLDCYKTLTVRTIQNWESENPKYKVPQWYPGRNCELASFVRDVETGIKNERMTRLDREMKKHLARPISFGTEDDLEALRRKASYKRDHTHVDDDDEEEDDFDY